MRRVYDRVKERAEGYESVSSPDSKWVIVIGPDLAQKFPGLQVFASIWNRRIVIDRGNRLETLVQARRRGQAIHFYGDPTAGEQLRSLAATPGFKMQVILHDPAGRDVTFLIQEILKNLRVPSEIISTSVEEFAVGLEQLGLAA